MARTGAADGRSPGVDLLAMAGPVMGGSIGCVQGDVPMDGTLGVSSLVQHCGQGSGTTPRALPAVTPCFQAGGAGAAHP